MASMFPEKKDWLNPLPFYAKMRKEAPIMYDESIGAWAVFGYQDVARVLTEYQTFSRKRHKEEAQAVMKERKTVVLPFSMHSEDPPRHTEGRELTAKAFTEHSKANVLPKGEAFIEELFDKVDSSKSTDLVADVIQPLSLWVISNLFGVPEERKKSFRDWLETYFCFEITSNQSTGSMTKAMEEMGAYYLDLIEEKRKNPGSDVISQVLKLDPQGKILSKEQLAGNCVLMSLNSWSFSHGNTTVLYCLLKNPEWIEKLRQQPNLVANAYEEGVRYLGPGQGPNVHVVKDTELHGEKLEAGEMVFGWVGSANHDESVFKEPEKFIPTRSPNPHAAFGIQDHTCMGASFARTLGKTFVTAFVNRVVQPEIDPGATLERKENIIFYGLKRLPVRMKEVKPRQKV